MLLGLRDPEQSGELSALERTVPLSGRRHRPAVSYSPVGHQNPKLCFLNATKVWPLFVTFFSSFYMKDRSHLSKAASKIPFVNFCEDFELQA